MVATFGAVAWVDRFGRRPLLMIGSVGMGVSLVVVGAMFERVGKLPGGTHSSTTTTAGTVTLVALITEAGTFWLFAGFCAVTFVFVSRFVPETKGKSLEEVQSMWGDPDAVTRAITSRR